MPPPLFKNIRPGQSGFSAGQYNSLLNEVRKLMRLEFDGRFFVRQGNAVTLRDPRPRTQWRFQVKSGLDGVIRGGYVDVWDLTNVRTEQVEVADGEITLSSSSTNYVYLKSTLSPAVVETAYIGWEASTFSFHTATSEEANTVDFTDAVTGEGFLYTKLAEVVTDGSGVDTSATNQGITRFAFDTLPLNFPWTLNLDTFSCPS